MHRSVVASVLFLSLASPALSQVTTWPVSIRAVLVDNDLNQKPAPRLSIVVVRSDIPNSEQINSRTGFDGTAELRLPPGKYVLTTPTPVEFQGKQYSWRMSFAVSEQLSIELSNDNAEIGDANAGPRRVTDDMTALFRKYRNSVLTVWSEFGHGTGFVADSSGLILTNQHVIGASQYISVQFDENRKVEAKLVVADPAKDIAVLWADLTPFPEIVIAQLAHPNTQEAAVVEGERVFTIGSPLNQQKILTTGVVSKVARRAILSDISINHGNSGGPLFNAVGTVIGLTTFADADNSGPGVSGIIRIEEAELVLAGAKAKMMDITAPEPALLPVEPLDPYPLEALKVSLSKEQFDERPYIFGQGDYDVAIITPVLRFHLSEGVHLQAQKQKQRRVGKAVPDMFRPLDDLKDWAEYVGSYRPVIFIQASPKLGETVMSVLRGYAAPATMKFKTDFHRMRLLCGEKEIQPIHPGKIPNVVSVHNAFLNVTDATYQGFYSYPYDAISSECGTVTLELYSEKEPDKAVSKILGPKTIARVTADFAPFRKNENQSEAEKIH
jgi:S1-C subfamily serine protease